MAIGNLTGTWVFNETITTPTAFTRQDVTPTYIVCDLEYAEHNALDLCSRYPMLRAGICCSSYQQFAEIYAMIQRTSIAEVPSVERIRGRTDSLLIEFNNQSTLEIFIGRDTSRGKYFHWLLVDKDVNDALQNDVLRHLVRNYEFDETLNDLFLFAESSLQQPLHRWQREMLMSMLTGSIYVTGRSLGKQQMVNIYNEWRNPSQLTYDIELTYNELMKQEK